MLPLKNSYCIEHFEHPARFVVSTILYLNDIILNMEIDEYSKKALRTDYKTYEDFHSGDATPRLEYAVIGLVTESAKVLDVIKKTKKNLTPLFKEKVIEELGDLLWYLNLAIDELGITFTDVMNNNVEKIQKKYPPDDQEASKLIRN